MNRCVTNGDSVFDLLGIPAPNDAEFPEYAFNLSQRIARSLGECGWKFEERKGPRGYYFEGYGPNGQRIMSEQKPTREASILAALRHANGVQFPLFF